MRSGWLQLQRQDLVEFGGLQRLVRRVEPDVADRQPFVLLVLRQKGGAEQPLEAGVMQGHRRAAIAPTS